jgi:hypothetical protein
MFSRSHRLDIGGATILNDKIEDTDLRPLAISLFTKQGAQLRKIERIETVDKPHICLVYGVSFEKKMSSLKFHNDNMHDF